MSNETKPKTNTKKIVIIIVSVIAGIILLAVILSAIGGSNPAPKLAKIGESVKNDDDITFTINSVQNTKTLGEGDFADTTDNNFILITLTVNNTSKEAITISGSCIDLYNEANIKLEEYTSLYIDYIISEDLNPGVSKTFQVAFETSTKTTEEKYIAKIGYSVWTADSNRVNIELF